MMYYFGGNEKHFLCPKKPSSVNENPPKPGRAKIMVAANQEQVPRGPGIKWVGGRTDSICTCVKFVSY